jgi:hypothetical protein
MYSRVVTADGMPVNAQRAYAEKMGKTEFRLAGDFWSVTPYDFKNCSFILKIYKGLACPGLSSNGGLPGACGKYIQPVMKIY